MAHSQLGCRRSYRSTALLTVAEPFQQHLTQQLWVATWTKLRAQYETVRSISVRDKRVVFGVMRSSEVPISVDTFLPHIGLFVGELCLWQILSESSRRDEAAPAEEEDPGGQGGK
jgi:hypothetical protein